MKKISAKRWKEIWTKIGDAFATPKEHRTIDQKMLTCWGLCFAIGRAIENHNEYITFVLYFDSVGFSHKECFWYKPIPRHDKHRATAAYFIAAMGPTECKRVCRDGLKEYAVDNH